MRKIRKSLLFLIVLFVCLLSLWGCSTKTSKDKVSSVKEGEAKVQIISTQDLQDKIGQQDWIIVDTRINDAFNGWQLDGISRGGHIKGAVDFAANWLKVDVKDKEEKLAKVLKDKGIKPEKNIVLYDANGKDAKEVEQYLKSKGINNIYLYDIKEWASNQQLPMESYPNYQMVVPATWINDLIKDKNNGKPYKIFEASWGEESKDYIKEHIPGAVHINTDEVEEGPLWRRIADKRLEKFAMNNGITVDTTVVLYGADPMPAFRVAAILKYMGVKDVRVLNGGYASWANSGFQVEKTINKKSPVKSFGAVVPVNGNYIIGLPEAKQILSDKNGRLVDIRSWDEHIGKTSGYDYIKGKGRPAGAVWGHAGTDNSNLDDFRNIDLTMRNGAEILKFWGEWNIMPENKLSFFCGTGWRAAEVLTYADVMGLQNISLYDPGWNEWSRTNNPIEKGEPKK